MGCSVERTRKGLLALRFRYEGRHPSVETGLEDTRENRDVLRAKAKEIGADLRRGTFDWETWFPGRRQNVTPSKAPSRPLFVEFPAWLREKRRLRVRPSRIRDYESHWENYLSRKLGNHAVGDLAREEVIREVRAWLIGDRGLAEKTARNVVRGTLRAFARDHAVSLTGFDAVRWERYVVGDRQDPFSADERDRIIEEFRVRTWGRGRVRRRSPGEWGCVAALFLVGLRPSEATALRVGDYDRATGTLRVSKSRDHGVEAATKTVASDRWAVVPDDAARIIGAVIGVRQPDEHLFVGWDGQPIEQDNLSDTFRRVLVKLGIRVRAMKQTRHTCAVLRLMAGENPTLVAGGLGHSLATLERNYAWAIREGRIVRQLSVREGKSG